MAFAPGRQGVIAFFVTFCICLVALAAALSVGWIVLTLREIVPLLIGSIIFAAIITGLILNTTFLVREIRMSEQQDAFINAVTHELKTPIASIRLYLETLKTRDVDEEQRREFYNIMLADSERLLKTVEQVLRAFATLYAEAADKGGRVLTLTITPWLMGQPHRIRALGALLDRLLEPAGVWPATGAEIVDAWQACTK